MVVSSSLVSSQIGITKLNTIFAADTNGNLLTDPEAWAYPVHFGMTPIEEGSSLHQYIASSWLEEPTSFRQSGSTYEHGSGQQHLERDNIFCLGTAGASVSGPGSSISLAPAPAITDNKFVKDLDVHVELQQVDQWVKTSLEEKRAPLTTYDGENERESSSDRGLSILMKACG